MLTKGCVAVPGPRVPATELDSADGGVGASSGGGGYAASAGDGDLALAVSGAVSRPHRAVRPILLKRELLSARADRSRTRLRLSIRR